MLSKIAAHSKNSRGRLYEDDLTTVSNCFQRDRDRIINSGAFRRLAYKTQVFVNHVGDHYRTRLTHSLEVSQIARTIAGSMNLCEDLAETLALSHDIGHPPFGHAGEDALNFCMSKFGGFDHNAQTIKIVTELEKRYAGYDGLNLTWETLEGIAKHNGPLIGSKAAKQKALDPIIIKCNKLLELELDKFASLEAQIASLSDDIAYNNHDLEDGCRAKLITVEELESVELISKTIRTVEKKYGKLPSQRLIFEATRYMKQHMIADLIKTTTAKIKELGIETCEEIRNADQPLVCTSEVFTKYNLEIREILTRKVYNHYKVSKMSNKARHIIIELFKIFMNDPACLPTEWKSLIKDQTNEEKKARVICDYISGMTDRFVIKEYQSFFDLSQSNIFY